MTKTQFAIATDLVSACKAKNIRLTTAESCTGGLIGAALTDVAGSSVVFDGGYITYSYEAKTATLGVSADMLMQHGAVSEDVAAAMAEGALRAANGRTELAVAVTGIAGPGGGTEDKPVGLVCFGIAGHGIETYTEQKVFSGNRQKVREQTVTNALELLLKTLQASAGASE